MRNGRGWLIVIAAVVAFGRAGTALAQDEAKLPKVEKILERVVQAYGGQEAMEKISTRVCKGTVEISMGQKTIKGTVERYEQAPNRKYYVIDLGRDGTIKGGSDGDVCWRLPPMGPPVLLEGEEKAEAERNNTFNPVLHWRDLYSKIECVGKEDVDGHTCYKVTLTPDVGTAETVFLDRKTGLPLKYTSTSKGETGEVPIETLMLDYKEVGGVQFAHKTVRKIGTGPEAQTVTTVWTSVEHNADIPEERLALPADVKTAAEQIKKPKPADAK